MSYLILRAMLFFLFITNSLSCAFNSATIFTHAKHAVASAVVTMIGSGIVSHAFEDSANTSSFFTCNRESFWPFAIMAATGLCSSIVPISLFAEDYSKDDFYRRRHIASGVLPTALVYFLFKDKYLTGCFLSSYACASAGHELLLRWILNNMSFI